MNTEETIHLFIEAGPDKGRQISVPANGARIGRTDNNDIVLNDASLSRFHCRVYFKPDRQLWIADLGSTNETMVNHKSIHESMLKSGDRVVIGDTTILVINEKLDSDGTVSVPATAVQAPPAAAVAPAVAPAPPQINLAQEPAVPVLRPAAEATPAHIDLGFDGSAETVKPGGGSKKILWVSIVCILLVMVLAVVKFVFLKPLKVDPQTDDRTVRSMEIAYEKIHASRNNIFRYFLTLNDNILGVRIDNIEEGRHIFKEKEIDDDAVKDLAQTIEQEGFFTDAVKELVEGMANNEEGHWDMSITINNRTKRAKVVNMLEPMNFSRVREKLEEFAQAELGLFAISLPPEELKKLAYESYLNAQSLFESKEVKHVNLYRAIQAYQQTDYFLATIEPKPDYYPDVIRTLTDATALLEERYKSREFQAIQKVNLKEWEDAANQLKIILLMIPDGGDERNKKARAKLLEVERRLGK